MTITVAVASFNHRAYISQCLLSIVAQTYENLELSWVDDSSTDGSYEELQRVLERPDVRNRFKNIYVSRNRKNRGAAFSLNKAARMGTAAIISFVNSDDFYLPSRLMQCAPQGRTDGMYFAFSNVLPVDQYGGTLANDPIGERIAFDADLLVNKFGSVSRAFVDRQIASSTGNFVVSRELFEKIGGFVDLKYCHDWLFALEACVYCEPIFIKERLYCYRLHPSNSFRSLAEFAEHETNYVLTRFFERIALGPVTNRDCPCPRSAPSGFWELLSVTGTRECADRVFFPYKGTSRLLNLAK